MQEFGEFSQSGDTLDSGTGVTIILSLAGLPTAKVHFPVVAFKSISCALRCCPSLVQQQRLCVLREAAVFSFAR